MNTFSHTKLETYVTTLPDQCAAQAGSLSWCIKDDRSLVCDTTSGSKVLNTLADVMCEVTKQRGVTEVRMIDHSLQAKLKARIIP